MSKVFDALPAAPGGIVRTTTSFAVPHLPAVPRETVRLGEGRSVAYADAGGHGPDVVLIHGTLMTLEDMWLGPLPALAEEFRVVAVDRPGHGESRRSRFFDASPWRQAAILHAAVRAIGLHRPTVVGHSAGGAVALAYGMLFPEDVAGIVALAPICFPEPRLEQGLFGPRAAPFAGDLLAAGSRLTVDAALLPLLWRAMFLPQRMPSRFETDFPFASAGRATQMVAEAEDSLALGPALIRSAFSYPLCRVPVEILGGDSDIVVNNLVHGYRAAAMIPKGTYRSLPGMGHMLHHFQPDEVLNAVRRIGRPA